MVAAGHGPGRAGRSGQRRARAHALGPADALARGHPDAEELAEADAWAAEGIRRGTDLTPGARRRSQQRARRLRRRVRPGVGELTIIMRCGVEFTDGISRPAVARPGLAEPARPRERAARAAAPSSGSPSSAGRRTRATRSASRSRRASSRRSRASGAAATSSSCASAAGAGSARRCASTSRSDDKEDVPNAHLTMRPVKVPAGRRRSAPTSSPATSRTPRTR